MLRQIVLQQKFRRNTTKPTRKMFQNAEQLTQVTILHAMQNVISAGYDMWRLSYIYVPPNDKIDFSSARNPSPLLTTLAVASISCHSCANFLSSSSIDRIQPVVHASSTRSHDQDPDVAECEPREGRSRYVNVEPVVTESPRGLAVNISEHHEDREDPGDVLVRVVLDCAQFATGTNEHVYFLGSKHHGREDEDAGSAGLRVFLDAEVSLPGDTPQEYSAMRSNAQHRLANGTGGISSRDHDKGRGEGPRAVQVLHNVHVLRGLVLQHGDAVLVANARARAERHRTADGIPRLRHPVRLAADAGLRVRLLPAMLHRYRHVQCHHVRMLPGSDVRGSRLRPDRHCDNSRGESRERRATHSPAIREMHGDYRATSCASVEVSSLFGYLLLFVAEEMIQIST